MRLMLELLDLFCGAGGATKGYQQAGFRVTGVDINPQPNYCGNAFVQADALEYVAKYGKRYHAIHASPPCQDYSVMRNATGVGAPRLINATRDLLVQTGRPYVIENVEPARPELREPWMLCGTMFGLRVRRHRLFEIQPPLLLLVPPCSCKNGVRDGRLIGQMLSGKVAPGRTPRHGYTESQRREAIGVPWMTTMEARQAIPPAYTEFIGQALLEEIAKEDYSDCDDCSEPRCSWCDNHYSTCQCPGSPYTCPNCGGRFDECECFADIGVPSARSGAASAARREG